MDSGTNIFLLIHFFSGFKCHFQKKYKIHSTWIFGALHFAPLNHLSLHEWKYNYPLEKATPPSMCCFYCHLSNINLFSHTFGDWKSKVSLTGLKSRCQQGWFLWGFWEGMCSAACPPFLAPSCLPPSSKPANRTGVLSNCLPLSTFSASLFYLKGPWWFHGAHLNSPGFQGELIGNPKFHLSPTLFFAM